jgi:hypothetical protein
VNALTDGIPDLQNANAPTITIEMPSSRDQEITTPLYVDSANERKTPLDLAIENDFEKCGHVLRDNGALVFYELQHLAATIIQVCCNLYFFNIVVLVIVSWSSCTNTIIAST